jgi:hypothetical protein
LSLSGFGHQNFLLPEDAEKLWAKRGEWKEEQGIADGRLERVLNKEGDSTTNAVQLAKDTKSLMTPK